jgi:dihydroorotase
MALNLTLQNGQVLKDGQLKSAGNLFITNGQWTQKSSAENSVLNLEGKIIFPGLIDPHVHSRDFNQAHKEDFSSVSLAAARGGYTFFLDMPNTAPPVLDLATLEKRKIAAKKSVLPVRFHFGSSAKNNLLEIKKALKDPQVVSIKIYMNHTTGDLLIEDEKLLKEIFSVAHSKIVTVHAEEEKVEQALFYAKKSQTRLYFCHISLESELDLIRKSKKQNGDLVFTEVTPHHLFLNEGDYSGSLTAMRPPLRSKKDQEALWEAIESGLVNTIGTDHAPHTLAEKESATPPPGVPGLETALPLMLTAWKDKRISLAKIQELMFTNPALIFNLKNPADFLRPQTKPDFTVIDPDKERLAEEGLLTKCCWTTFAGKKLTGWPILTVANGEMVYSAI